jgi:hypothetical protein
MRLPANAEFLDQPVVEFARPFAAEESDDRLAAGEELRPVAPTAVRRVAERDTRRVAAVPGILGFPRLFDRGVAGERRDGRANFQGGLLVARLRR